MRYRIKLRSKTLTNEYGGTNVIVDGDIIGHSTLTKLRQVLTELDDTFAKDISKTIVSAFPNNISLKSHRLLCSIDGFAIGMF